MVSMTGFASESLSQDNMISEQNDIMQHTDFDWIIEKLKNF